MIPRKIQAVVLGSAESMPIVSIVGPRQSGKTTLARSLFKDHGYVSLENPDTRAYALEDPRGFLEDHKSGAILRR